MVSTWQVSWLGFIACCAFPGLSQWLIAAGFPLQWRDRTGFSPVSLLSAEWSPCHRRTRLEHAM